MSDNLAILEGYSEGYIAYADCVDIHVLVKPDTDLDGTFRAWDCDNQEFISVNGWLFVFEPTED